LYALPVSRLLDKDEAAVPKAGRQLAKAANFEVICGSAETRQKALSMRAYVKDWTR
jgi:hypothetical protein